MPTSTGTWRVGANKRRRHCLDTAIRTSESATSDTRRSEGVRARYMKYCAQLQEFRSRRARPGNLPSRWPVVRPCGYVSRIARERLSRSARPAATNHSKLILLVVIQLASGPDTKPPVCRLLIHRTKSRPERRTFEIPLSHPARLYSGRRDSNPRDQLGNWQPTNVLPGLGDIAPLPKRPRGRPPRSQPPEPRWTCDAVERRRA